MKKFVLFFFLIIASVNSYANVLLELGGTYLSDSLKESTTNTSSKYFYNVGLLFTLNKNIWGGWNYLGVNNTETANSVTTDFATADTGPYLKWQFGKSQLFSMSFAYNILSRATYKSGTNTSESWSGTSYWFSFGLMPEVRDGFHLGAAINYYAANYTKKTVSGSESSASNTKSWIFPSLSLTKEW